MEKLLTELDAAALLAHACWLESTPGLAGRLCVSEKALLAMIEGRLPMPRRVVRYLGLRREVRYVRVA